MYNFNKSINYIFYLCCKVDIFIFMGMLGFYALCVNTTEETKFYNWIYIVGNLYIYIYIYILNVFDMLTKAAFIVLKYNKAVILIIITKIENMLNIIYFKIKCIHVMAKLNSQHHYSSLKCQMILLK